MRRIMMLLVIVATLALSAARPSQADNLSFGLQAGAAVPLGDYGDALGIGPMFGVFGDYPLTPQVALGADIVGNFHGISSSLKDDLAAAGATDFDFNFTVIQFGGHLKWRPAPTGLWLLGGLGMYQGSSKVKFAGLEDTSSETKFGYNVGAGFDFATSPSMNLGLMASFHSVPDAIDEFDNTGPTGNTTAAQWVGIGATLTFLTAPR